VDATTRYPVDDRSYIDHRVDAVSDGDLEGPVRSFLGDATARVTRHRHDAVAYDYLNPSSGGVYRFFGTAQTADGERAWSLVLKVTRDAETLEHETPVPEGLARSLSDAVLWDRELRAYENGFLGQLDGELVAAPYHGGSRHDDDTCWLWLEDLGGDDASPWPLERWARVGHALGAFNGAFLAAHALPSEEWLGRRWLRVWSTQITPWLFGRGTHDGPAWEHAAVRAAYSKALRERVWPLWAAREELLGAVDRLPQTCSHLDAHRRNLFARGDRFVAIDWGLLGLAAPGEEIASTLVGTVASGELPAEAAGDLAATLYEGYLAGLRDAGWHGDERDVRLGFTAAAGLRAFSILGLDVVDWEPDADAAAAALVRYATLAEVLVGLGEEARATIGR
jgi:hypothetical protein